MKIDKNTFMQQITDIDATLSNTDKELMYKDYLKIKFPLTIKEYYLLESLFRIG